MNGINNVAAYFGDPVLTTKEIEDMELEMFKSQEMPSGKGTPTVFNDFLI